MIVHGTCHIPELELRKLACAALEEVGVPSLSADTVASVLVDADVRGHPSHGVALLPLYRERVIQGGIAAKAVPVLQETTASVSTVDARQGFGQLAAELAAETCASKAAEHGLAAVGVRGNNHIGMLAAYRHHFSDAGVTGVLLNVSGPSVAAPGAQRATLGNDAVCLVVPRKDAEPFIVDFATGVVACGKIRAAALRGESVPSDWLLDSSGRPSEDPEDLDDGGSVPVFGGHKGLGVLLITEVLAGVLAGGTVSPLVNRQRHHPDKAMNCSQLFLGFRPDLFGTADTDALLESLLSAVTAGYDSRPPWPHLPEQQESEHALSSGRLGVPIPVSLAADLGWEAA